MGPLEGSQEVKCPPPLTQKMGSQHHILQRLRCFNRKIEQILIQKHQQHQSTSRISASAGSTHQQDQLISVSAGSAHQQGGIKLGKNYQKCCFLRIIHLVFGPKVFDLKCTRLVCLEALRVYLQSRWFQDDKNDIPKCSMHKYRNRNIQIH